MSMAIHPILFALAAAAAPAPVPPPAAVAAPLDPARLAAARPVIDRLWPLGTYKRMMDRTLDTVMGSMMSSMFDMKARDFPAPPGRDTKAATAEVGDKSLGELAEARDPAFRERMKLTMDVMMGEMVKLMTDVEPEVRDALVRSYANQYTAAQLGELDRFFTTPTGALYAKQSLLVFTDPEMMKAMQAFTPRMMKAMPDIMKKVEAATAHLPPAPKPIARK